MTWNQKYGPMANGMLGVNGYSGQVWHHNWHGTFIGNKEVVGTNQR
jgi:hypothetical protein